MRVGRLAALEEAICTHLPYPPSVPRAHFAKLEGVSDTVPTPRLHCVTGMPYEARIFQSVDAAFGRLIDTGTAALSDYAQAPSPPPPQG